MIKEILKRAIKSYSWSNWVDIETYSNEYASYLIQMKQNKNGKKVFRTTFISGNRFGYRFLTKGILLEQVKING
jgi:hypothetical protein